MKILFLSRLFYPHIGGVEKHVLEISKILIKNGHSVTVITEQHSKSLKVKEVIEGIQIYRIPNLKEGKTKKFQIWKWFWKNKKEIKNADIVHCHDVFFWYLPFKVLFPSKKVFTTFHGYEDYPLKSSHILIHKISEKMSIGNICVGDFIKKWYGTRPDFITYGGVNIIKDGDNGVKNTNSALFIGRLDKQTGVLSYNEAVKIIRNKIPDFEFLIIGDGDLKSEINRKNKILRPIGNAAELFKDYNFAFVSRYLSIMEAMVAKRLVFAVYDNPLKEDYLRMAPFSKYITISNTPSELVSKISFYLDNVKAKDKKVKEAYAWAKKQTWKKMAETYLVLWKK